MMRSGLLAVAAAGSRALVPGVASAQSLISVTAPVSVTVPGTVGSSVTCINGNCYTLSGVSDLTVMANVSVNGLTAPVITPALPQGCTLPIQAGATITPAGLGSASVDVAISYTSGGTPHDISVPVTLAPGGKPLTVTECAS